nr:PREDICTED: apolipoprotein C-I [Anolis carolinensis]|eukprot:XP_003230683.2 PREDICTED: apolipoprotein C-I [Anolis carolinensis]
MKEEKGEGTGRIPLHLSKRYEESPFREQPSANPAQSSGRLSLQSLVPFLHQEVQFSSINMQIVLSVAVVLVALSVVAGTDETPVANEPSLSQKLEKFKQEVQTFVDRVGVETKETLHDIRHSEFGNRTRNWFSEKFRKLKEKFRTLFPREEAN